jgi:TolB-like protein/tetratricopeptide (TPR) repeat protein
MKKLHHCLTILFSLFLIFLATSSFAKSMNILVHPFENTGDKEFSWISAGMTDTVVADLARIRNISVVSNADRRKILEEMKFIFSGLVEADKMIKLGKLTGANVIFTGSYLVSGKRIRVHARLVNVETGKIESTAKIDGTLSGIFDLQDKVVFTLMGETEKIQIADVKPVKLTEEDKRTIEDKPKPKASAYKWYAKGLELQDTNPKEALVNFRKALDIDPSYTDALIRAGFTAGDTFNLFSEAIGYLEKAERVLKNRNETNTADYAALMNSIGNVYVSSGQLDRALEYYTNAKSIKDRLGLQNTAGYAKLMNNIGIVYSSEGQLDRALEYYLNSQFIRDRLGFQETDDYAGLMGNIGVDYWRKGQTDRALEYYLNAKSIEDSLGLHNTADYATLIHNLAILYETQGKRSMAGRYYRMAYDTCVKAGYSGSLRNESLQNAERLGY